MPSINGLQNCHTTKELIDFLDIKNVRVQVDFGGRRFTFGHETVCFKEMVQQLEMTLHIGSDPNEVRKALKRIDRLNNIGNNTLERSSALVRFVVFVRSQLGKISYNGYSNVYKIRRKFIEQFGDKSSIDLKNLSTNRQLGKKILEVASRKEQKLLRVFLRELIHSKEKVADALTFDASQGLGNLAGRAFNTLYTVTTEGFNVQAKCQTFIEDLENILNQKSPKEKALFKENVDYYLEIANRNTDDWKEILKTIS